MKLKTLSALCLAASTLAMTSTAMAWESEDGQHATSASVALSSDYRFRGISFSDNKPAVSGSLDYAHASGLYAGIWMTSNSFEGETNIYGGYSADIGDTGLSYDVGVLRYIFPGNSEFNNNEFYGSLSYSYFTAGIAYDPDWEGNDEAAIYYSLGFDYELPAGFGLFASYGYTDFDSDLKDVVGAGESGYADWSIGITKNFIGFDWSLAYIDVDSDGQTIYSGANSYGGLDKSASDDTVVLTIGKSF
jgi:uncharacterized protein (TIGR02001 family)